MICNRSEDRDLLIPYINKPVYVKGYCWNKSFDGWVVIYEGEESKLIGRNLVFDYRGKQYSVFGFCQADLQCGQTHRITMHFIKKKLANKNKILWGGGIDNPKGW